MSPRRTEFLSSHLGAPNPRATAARTVVLALQASRIVGPKMRTYPGLHLDASRLLRPPCFQREHCTVSVEVSSADEHPATSWVTLCALALSQNHRRSSRCDFIDRIPFPELISSSLPKSDEFLPPPREQVNHGEGIEMGRNRHAHASMPERAARRPSSASSTGERQRALVHVTFSTSPLINPSPRRSMSARDLRQVGSVQTVLISSRGHPSPNRNGRSRAPASPQEPFAVFRGDHEIKSSVLVPMLS